jgi:hypothetical protein
MMNITLMQYLRHEKYTFSSLILFYTECKLLLWGSKWFQIKMLLNTKFHNFLRSRTFIWKFLHPKSFTNFKIQTCFRSQYDFK